MSEQQYEDYQKIIRTIESAKHDNQFDAIYKLISLFDQKWRNHGDVHPTDETIELIGILKYVKNKN
jgi:hypothetical protein